MNYSSNFTDWFNFVACSDNEYDQIPDNAPTCAQQVRQQAVTVAVT
jgi:hypothetical protein